MATLERREQTPGHVTYRVRWRADGKQHSKSFTRHEDAKRFRAVVSGDLVNGSYIDPKAGAVTLESFTTANLMALTIDVRASTRARMLSIYKTHIFPEFGAFPLAAITAPAIESWTHRMLESLSPASVRKNAHVLRRVLDLAVNHGLLRANVAASVRLPAEPRQEQRYLTHDQAWKLAETIEPRFRAMVLVAVFGGLRFGEITGLQRKHILTDSNQIAVRQTMVEIDGAVTFGPPKTKSSIRLVTIPRSIMAELVSHMEVYTTYGIDSLVFTGQRGTELRRSWFYRYYWQPVAEGLRFHDLRHTFVALWVSLGRNPKEVSKAAGHSSVAFTLDRYGHLYDVDSDGLADELDALLGSSSPQRLGLTRTHETGLRVRQDESGSLSPAKPPSSSGLGRRPFTADSHGPSNDEMPGDKP